MIHQYSILQRTVIIFLLLVIFQSVTISQTLARFTVEPNPYQSDYTPVWVNLDLLTNLDENSLQLVEIMGKSAHLVTFQIEQGNPRKLYWMLNTTATMSTRVFELRKGEPHQETEMIAVSDHDGSLQVMSHHKPVLTYQYKTVYPPAGVDTFYKRSGFLHPVYAPDGAVLTNIQPKDHYHHYGIWNPWTKTSYEGKEIDFWNLSKHEGTVRFSGLISKLEGPVFGGFSAYQKHIVHPDSSEIMAINEIWDLKVFNTGEKEFLWDFTSTLNVPMKEIVLETYRYGGFGFRATDVWTNKNSKVVTSEGKSRKDADGSTAKWCYITGETGSGQSTILFMAFPSNYNYPEPIRVWPEDSNNGRGDVFFNFCPTKNKDWKLIPGKDYVLRYRVMIKNGEITSEEAEKTWNSFATAPKIEIRQLP